uniref:Glycosyl hydrolase family 32 N-terminal domain-containing protein n=1 Tax=Aegilops tauschii subsp. strangulata TaxID=200361 RepID=A0A453QAQ6_AEGTS
TLCASIAGPVYYGGWYHFFYQYNPSGSVWEPQIVWGHAVSKDLIHWRHLPPALVPDQWYDIKGVLTGSITVLPDGKVILLYTGNTETFAQVTCLAEPADPSDPLLREWVKHPANPVVFPPPGIGMKDFRDPTTAWFDESDGTWRTIIGSKNDSDHSGIVFSYKTKDFLSYELMPGYMYRGPKGTGEYECIDLYAVGGGRKASDMYNSTAEDVLYVLKESSDDDRHDWYSLGRFDAAANKWTPIDEELELGVGLRYDWGKYYASKSFYDPVKKRRVVWAYVGETDSERADITKGWANLQVTITLPTLKYIDTIVLILHYVLSSLIDIISCTVGFAILGGVDPWCDSHGPVTTVRRALAVRRRSHDVVCLFCCVIKKLITDGSRLWVAVWLSCQKLEIWRTWSAPSLAARSIWYLVNY